MTRVIKAGDLAHGLVIAPYTIAGEAERSAAATPVRRDPREAERARLEALLAEREAELEDLRGALAKARAEGEEAGRLAAELEFEDDRTAGLERLEQGIAAARDAMGQWHEHAETLALLIARSALAKLFAGDEARTAAVTDLVRRQLAVIERDTVLAVTVARRDFPDTREVAALAAKLGIEPGLLAVSDDLDAGGCRMKLQLGTLDLGLDRQWGAVRDLLDGLAGLAPDSTAECAG
ncbi:MAG: hypothetical protein KGN34_09985 [Sphingomonadales bacterium]|nr:hypothetical protein [Sphingomonadales bacterium]